MNRRKEEPLKHVYERIQEIKKKIQKAQTQIQQQPRFPWRPMFMYNVYFNFNFINVPPFMPHNLKYIKPRKPKNYIDDIPLLVGVDELQQREICAICLQDLNETKLVKILKCNHFYHNECLKEWLLQKPECPTCRDKIR